jgi:myo-inositol-1(or 4)-monophosphatase
VSALDLLHPAKTAAARAAEYLRTVQRPTGPEQWALKGARDFVTEVDRTAEAIIADILLAAEPSAQVVGEELNPQLVTRGLVWVVDPLDGTTNFLHDYPSYAVSIGAAIDGVLQAAVVVHIPRNETYTAAVGSGAWLGERRLKVSTIVDPAFALIGTGFPFKEGSDLAAYQRQFARVSLAASGIRRPGSAAIDLADVAAGRFDGFWEQHLSAWDIAAGILLIREAGGVATDFQGRHIGVEHTGVVAGNPAIQGWLLATLPADP